MKKERNCGMPYPAYPPYGVPMSPMNPNMVDPTMMNGYPNAGANQMSQNTLQEQLNNIQGQINMLDKRITSLENTCMGQKENLTGSNYHIM